MTRTTLAAATSTAPPSTTAAPRPGRVLTALALVWSLAAVAASVLWAVGVLPYPFASDPGTMQLAAAEFLPRGVMIGGAALLGVVGIVIAVRMLRTPRGSVVASQTLAGAVLAVAVLVVADARLMAFLGYALSLRPQPLDDQIATQAVAVLGGVVWLGAATARARRGRRRVLTDGRPASRVAVVAAVIACVIPLIYASTRFAWAAGIPLGIDEEFLREGQESGLWLIGLGLALVATVGGLLALGLVQRWGERLPGWVPALGGRRVPVLLAVIPASIAAASITASGLGFVRIVATGEMSLDENWTTIGPELLWPLWGVALAVATVAYARRRVEWRPKAELAAW